MAIASQITVSMKPELSKSLMSMNALAPGSILKLKILELRGDRALIDFGKFRATAEIKIPVVLGEELRVRVLASGKQLIMGVISPEAQNFPGTEVAAGHLKAAPADRLQNAQADLKETVSRVLVSQVEKSIDNNIINIFKNLNSYYEPIELTKKMTELTQRLKAYLEHSGIFFEKHLENSILKSFGNSESVASRQTADLPDLKQLLDRDLKANLMTLKFIMADKEALQKIFTPRSLAAFKNSVDSLLSEITQQQGRAAGQLDSVDPNQVFTFSLPLKEGGMAARLKVYFHKKQKTGANRGFRISLLLSLDRLGDLRTDLFLLDKDLALTFFVKKDSVKIDLEKNFPELQELLDGFFDHLRLKVVVSEKKVTAFDHEDLLRSGDRKVDLRI